MKGFFLLLNCLVNLQYACFQTITFNYDASGNLISKTVNGTKPAVKTSGDTLVCQCAIAKISSSGANTYQWSIGGTGNSISVIADSPRKYSVIGTNIKGCKDTAYHFLNVVLLPANDTIYGDTLAFINTKDTFSAPYHAGSSYKWLVTNGTLLTATDTNVVEVLWGSATGIGTVEAYQTVNNGMCKTPSVFKNVRLIDFPTSVQSNDKIGLLKVYPNPAQNGVQIDFVPIYLDDYSLSIYSADGRNIYKEQLTKNNSYRIYLSDKIFLISGEYQIHIISKAGQVSAKLTYIKN